MTYEIIPVRWRHKKRGSEYTLLSFAKLQCSSEPKLDESEVCIYQGDDGQLWVRLKDEFFDGRFEEVK